VGLQQTTVTVDPGLKVTFQATSDPDAPSRLVVFERYGEVQATSVGTTTELRVRVEDRFGNPVPDVRVGWKAERGGLDRESTSSGADGLATNSWTPKLETVGWAEASASLGWQEAEARFVRWLPQLVDPASSVLEGQWRVESYELFRDSSRNDMLASVSGTWTMMLSLSPRGSGVWDYWYRETYPHWPDDEDHATVIKGRAMVSTTGLKAVVEEIRSTLECDWLDCDGPLHGDFRMVVLPPDRILLESLAPIWAYLTYGSGRLSPAWSALMLARPDSP